MKSNEHYSVLLNEAIQGLNIKSDGIYLDATLGRAGHSKVILKNLKEGRLVGIDQDDEALEFSKNELGFGDSLDRAAGDRVIDVRFGSFGKGFGLSVIVELEDVAVSANAGTTADAHILINFCILHKGKILLCTATL